MSTEFKERTELKKGEARCPGAPTTQEIIAADKVAAPGWVRSESYEFLGDKDIPTDRYIDPAYAKLEFDRLWTRTWQFACREEHIPEVGDYYVYDIGPYSFIVTRVGKNEVRAYYNACLHRGTKLRGSGTRGQCERVQVQLSRLELEHRRLEQDGRLPVGFSARRSQKALTAGSKGRDCWADSCSSTWIRKRRPLADYLGPVAKAHIDAWKLEDRYVYLHVSKRFACNWKLAIEAFMEAYHVINTHPQVAVSNGDANSQYDVYGEHVDRFISTLGVLSPHLYGKYTEQDILNQFTLGDSGALDGTKRTLGNGGTARQVMAEMFRGMFEQATNTDLSRVSDSELLDCFSYTIFPNCFLFPGISLPMVYRFRPDPRDHRKCIYEVLFLRPVPVDGKRPEPAEPIHLPTISRSPKPRAWIRASAPFSIRIPTICSCSRRGSKPAPSTA